MPAKLLHISLDSKLVEALDKAALAEYSARTDYLRKALVNQLREDARKTDLKQLIHDLADDITDSAIAVDSDYHYLSFQDFVNKIMLQRDSVQNKENRP